VRTEGRDETNGRLSQFANVPNQVEISHLDIIKDFNLNRIYAARTAQ